MPTCPGWAVKDVVAHLAGVCADVLAGRLDGVATESWTEAQVVPRREMALDQILDEWADVAPQVEAIADHFPEPAGTQWVADLTSHEHDIRTALGRPGARDSAGVTTGVEFVVTVGLDAGVKARGLPALAVQAGDRAWAVGDGEPAGSLEASTFDLARALTGRRSIDQIRKLDWSVDPEPYLGVFQWGPFTPSPVDIDE